MQDTGFLFISDEHFSYKLTTFFLLLLCQAAARSLIAVCHQIGPNLTALQVLPKLKELFGELAFSQEASASSASFGGRVKDCKKKTDEVSIDSRMDLV